ncbi:MAG: zinc-finger domain-containing protein [Methylophilaceae bacterium]
MSDVKELEVTAKDLPLHCPTKEVALWASHPRVFLDIVRAGEVACPYCGTKYTLKESEVASPPLVVTAF